MGGFSSTNQTLRLTFKTSRDWTRHELEEKLRRQLEIKTNGLVCRRHSRQTLSPKGVEKTEERRERLFESALEAEDDMKDRLKSVQSEFEELRIGLDVGSGRGVTEIHKI